MKVVKIVLINFSKSLQRYANMKYILITLGVFIATVMFMEIGPASSRELKSLSLGTGMLDMLLGYSQQKAYSMLEMIGVHGRFIYKVLLGIDFIFSVAFMLFQSLIITWILKRIDLPEYLGTLNLLPFLRSGFDMLENSMLLVMIFNYPVRLSIIAVLASMFTILKWVIYYVLIVLFIILGMVYIYQKFILKKKTRSGSV